MDDGPTKHTQLSLTVYGITQHGLGVEPAADVAKAVTNDPMVASADMAGTLDVPELLAHYDRHALAWKVANPR